MTPDDPPTLFELDPEPPFYFVPMCAYGCGPLGRIDVQEGVAGNDFRAGALWSTVFIHEHMETCPNRPDHSPVSGL